MSEDASLDRFLDGDDAEAREGTETEESAGTAERADGADDTTGAESEASTDDGGVTPAVTTYAWSAEGASCGACGETVQRRWQQDGALVCSRCKAWSES